MEEKTSVAHIRFLLPYITFPSSRIWSISRAIQQQLPFLLGYREKIMRSGSGCCCCTPLFYFQFQQLHGSNGPMQHTCCCSAAVYYYCNRRSVRARINAYVRGWPAGAALSLSLLLVHTISFDSHGRQIRHKHIQGVIRKAQELRCVHSLCVRCVFTSAARE
jgi:hypothetical protein